MLYKRRSRTEFVDVTPALYLTLGKDGAPTYATGYWVRTLGSTAVDFVTAEALPHVVSDDPLPLSADHDLLLAVDALAATLS